MHRVIADAMSQNMSVMRVSFLPRAVTPRYGGPHGPVCQSSYYASYEKSHRRPKKKNCLDVVSFCVELSDCVFSNPPVASKVQLSRKR
jgi:hypothetical protein